MTVFARIAADPVQVRVLLGVTMSALLIGCGSDDQPRQPLLAERSDIVAAAPTPGATAFISLIPLTGKSLQGVATYRYVIAPKPGTVSRPVDVRYSAAALVRKGYRSDGTSSATLPVFGLYAGHTNRVDLELEFRDSSRQRITLTVATPAYVDPANVFNRPTVVKKRESATAGDINFMYLKSREGGPVVVDSDAHVRWVAPKPTDGSSSAFADNGFVLGSHLSLAMERIELDGKTTSFGITPVSTYTAFHHNIDPGKTGLLGELDGELDGVKIVESGLVEFNSAGVITKEWDFAAIVSRHMRERGDDPALFVRPGIDWFHINAATYDRRDDSIIASSRESFVIKVDYSSGEIKWILGDPGKYWYSFPSLRAKALKLEAGGLYPIGQHATSIAPDGQLLLFNNGKASLNNPPGTAAGEERAYSAVSSYQIDPLAMTAREVWRFDNNKSLLSDICSSVYATRNGSMLVNYATANGRTRTRLVGLDASRSVTFDIEYTNGLACRTAWNAQPIEFDNIVFQ